MRLSVEELLRFHGAYNAKLPYHNFDHALQTLDYAYTMTKGRLSNELVVAILAHDAYYYPGATNNEEFTIRMLPVIYSNEEVQTPVNLDEVARLVKITIDHQPGDDDIAGQIISDADMAGFCIHWDGFAHINRNLVREYVEIGKFTPEQVDDGRKKFLEKMLERAEASKMYFYQPYRIEERHAAAVENLTRLLEECY